jgi:pimeloyl-ACP methyl ester carboxylesterase
MTRAAMLATSRRWHRDAACRGRAVLSRRPAYSDGGCELTADEPPGLAARADNDVCDEDALVHAVATLGRTSRIPTLWICAQNDKFLEPELASRMHQVFTGAGGRSSSSMSAIRR